MTNSRLHRAADPTTLSVPPYDNSTVTFVPIAAPVTAAATGS